MTAGPCPAPWCRSLLTSKGNPEFELEFDEKLWIRSVTKTETGYDIVIARKEFLCYVCFQNDPLSIKAGGKVIPVSSISKERPWDLKNGNILWEQMYSFNTTDKPEFLLMDGFQYIKTYNKKISIS